MVLAGVMNDSMVFSWSGVGGADSTTSKLNWSGGASGLSAGYGADSADRRIASALTDAGDDGWWLNKSVGMFREVVFVPDRQSLADERYYGGETRRTRWTLEAAKWF